MDGSTPFTPSDLADLLANHPGDRHPFMRPHRAVVQRPPAALSSHPPIRPSGAYIASEFTADIQAIARDDGAVWLNHAGAGVGKGRCGGCYGRAWGGLVGPQSGIAEVEVRHPLLSLSS